jgi:hypothetical protein
VNLFLRMIVLLVILVAAVGFYRGWFHANSRDTSGQNSVTLTVDKDQINRDKASATQKVQDLEHK